VECGLGRTSSPLRSYSALSTEPPSHAELRRRDEAARQRAIGTEGVFTSASFSPLGLDERWMGLRWFGGHGSSNGRVNRLELAHSDNPWDMTSAQVRVEAFPVERLLGDPAQDRALAVYSLAREQLQHFWHETGTLPEDVRHAVFPTDRRVEDPTAPWADARLSVDGAEVAFRVLATDDYWVAQARRGDLLLGIQARRWPPDVTGLVTIDNLQPYADGSRAIATLQR
jgi:hypothetical protein